MESSLISWAVEVSEANDASEYRRVMEGSRNGSTVVLETGRGTRDIARRKGMYTNTLRGIVRHCERSVSEIVLQSPAVTNEPTKNELLTCVHSALVSASDKLQTR